MGRSSASTTTSSPVGRRGGAGALRAAPKRGAHALFGVDRVPMRRERRGPARARARRGEPRRALPGARFQPDEPGVERIRRLLGTGSRDVVQAARRIFDLRRASRELEAAIASDKPLVVGPFLGEVSCGLVYWRPYVLRLLRSRGVDRERVTVVGRGGSGAWYDRVAARAVDALSSCRSTRCSRRSSSASGERASESRSPSIRSTASCSDAQRQAPRSRRSIRSTCSRRAASSGKGSCRRRAVAEVDHDHFRSSTCRRRSPLAFPSVPSF